MKFSIVSIVGLASVALAVPADLVVRETAVQATDRLLFSTSISGFVAARNAQNPSTLDWSSDGCSSSPDNPLGFNFENSCYRHDFGYRNYKAQSRFTDPNKLKIDNNFKTDLYNQCNSESFVSVCKSLADVYYAAVRAFGKKAALEVLKAAQPAAEEAIAQEIAKRAEVGA
ncbi:hypothetical protein N0V90_000132 [Kalmusia sp. IMI 367209]|nr:hypothetical protein N0V90_000132 [Kalmusia sp. IMI 367209]